MVPAWLVCFLDNDLPRRWWDVWTSPGFRHILAFGWDIDGQRWVVVDPSTSHMAFHLFEPGDPQVGGYMGAAIERWTCVRFEPRQERGLAPFAFGCVGAIKALLGVRCWAQRPRAFYRWLLANGGERVTRETYATPQPSRARPLPPGSAGG